jgi:predicted phage tail protein
MAKIHLYGFLAEKYAPVYELNVHSVPEAIRAIGSGRPGFSTDIKENSFRIVVGDLHTGVGLDDQSINLRTQRDIHIIPSVEGARGELKTVLGAVLFVAAFVLTGPMGSMAAIGAPMTLQVIQTAMYMVAISTFMSGVSMMLSPGVQDGKKENSGVFGNESGIAQQGNAIPLLYGQMYCDLMPISVAIENEVHDTSSSDPVWLAFASAIGGWSGNDLI